LHSALILRLLGKPRLIARAFFNSGFLVQAVLHI
jgi:hypothetical protein